MYSIHAYFMYGTTRSTTIFCGLTCCLIGPPLPKPIPRKHLNIYHTTLSLVGKFYPEKNITVSSCVLPTLNKRIHHAALHYRIKILREQVNRIRYVAHTFTYRPKLNVSALPDG